MYCLADFRAMKEVSIEDPPVSFSSNGVVEKVELKIYNVRPATDPRFISRRSNLWRLVSRHTHIACLARATDLTVNKLYIILVADYRRSVSWGRAMRFCGMTTDRNRRKPVRPTDRKPSGVPRPGIESGLGRSRTDANDL